MFTLPGRPNPEATSKTNDCGRYPGSGLGDLHRPARLPSDVSHQWLIPFGGIVSRDTALTVSGEALDFHQLPV
jgi:hypothetical protein